MGIECSDIISCARRPDGTPCIDVASGAAAEVPTPLHADPDSARKEKAKKKRKGNPGGRRAQHARWSTCAAVARRCRRGFRFAAETYPAGRRFDSCIVTLILHASVRDQSIGSGELVSHRRGVNNSLPCGPRTPPACRGFARLRLRCTSWGLLLRRRYAINGSGRYGRRDLSRICNR